MPKSDGPDGPVDANRARGGEIVRTRGQFSYLLAVFALLIAAALSVWLFA